MKSFIVSALFLLTQHIARGATDISGIISSDTTWSAAGSPYQMTGKVQIAYGATLTIAAGATVTGNNQALEVFGRLSVTGNRDNQVKLNNVKLTPGANTSLKPSLMDINYATIEGGSIWAATGNGTYGSVNIRDSLITSLGGDMIYLWYPTADCTFERNTFINSAGFSIGIDGPNVIIRNNVFYKPKFTNPTSVYQAVISCWAAYRGTIVVDSNSFLNISTGYALKLPSGYNTTALSAPNNYWGDLDTASIARLIYDQTKDLSTAGIINYQPILSAPAALTPSAPCLPIVASQSSDRSILVGQTTSLTVVATGNPAPTYQWQKNGVNLMGATNSVYTILSAVSSDAGTYKALISNEVGSISSASFALTVEVPLSAPSIITQPNSQTVIVGDKAIFSIAASGVPTPTYQWQKNGSAIPGATSSTYIIGTTKTTDAGNYTVIVTNSVSSITSNAGALTVTAPRLSNLSVRTALEANQIVIVGITMSGGAKNVLLRAAGPTLSAFGVPSVMDDPKLDLYSGSTKLTANDNWGGSPSLSAAFQSVGAFGYTSTTSLDAALVTSIDGGRTIQVSGPTAGTVVVEGYDAGSGDAQRFTNISARNKVGTGANILIAGFSLTGSGSRNLLIRAVGPTLSNFGVTSVLVDPKLEIYSGTTKITENDNWSSSLSSTFTSVGAFGLTPGSKDAAITVSLPAGGYTVQVSGADGGVGEAIVEIYELP